VRRGIGTLTALTVLFLVTFTVVGLHWSTTASRRSRQLVRATDGRCMVHMARAAVDEATWAFMTLVADDGTAGQNGRLACLLADGDDAAFLGVSATAVTTYAANGSNPIPPARWADAFRGSPRTFHAFHAPRFTRRHFAGRLPGVAVDDVEMTCTRCERPYGARPVEVVVRFRATCRTTMVGGGRLTRRYDEYLPLTFTAGGRGAIAPAGPPVVVLDDGLRRAED